MKGEYRSGTGFDYSNYGGQLWNLAFQWVMSAAPGFTLEIVKGSVFHLLGLLNSHEQKVRPMRLGGNIQFRPQIQTITRFLERDQHEASLQK